MVTLHHTDNAENKGSTLAVAILAATAAPFTLTVASGTPFANTTLPFILALAPSGETDSSSVEVMEVTARPGANTLTIAQRALNGTTAQNWSVGDKVEIRMTGYNHEELVDELETLQIAHPASNVFAWNNYG